VRIAVVLTVLLTACGSALSPSVAQSSPSPTPTPIPWLAATAISTPVPTAAPVSRPVDMPNCRAADVAAVFIDGQGATGWITRTFAIGNRATSSCIIDGPIRATYVDADGRSIVATTEESAKLNGRWAVLGPKSAPSGPDDRLDGEVMIGLATYGDCVPAPALASVTLTFAPPTGDVRIPMVPARVGGRCDAAGMPLNLGIFFPLAPAWWTIQPPIRTPVPSPFAFAIDVPSVAFAGEMLSYVVRIRNLSPALFSWSDGCPIYLEWLGGREISPTNVPGHIVKPLDPIYAGTAKESHTLNCLPAGAIAPNGEVAFEMQLAVPRDALGSERLTWQMMFWPGDGQVSATVEFFAPRR
jgi:hypothetical protein